MQIRRYLHGTQTSLQELCSSLREGLSASLLPDRAETCLLRGELTRRIRLARAAVCFATMGTLVANAQSMQKVDVTTNHNDLARTGANTRETLLTPQT